MMTIIYIFIIIFFAPVIIEVFFILLYGIFLIIMSPFLILIFLGEAMTKLGGE